MGIRKQVVFCLFLIIMEVLNCAGSHIVVQGCTSYFHFRLFQICPVFFV